MGNLLKGESYRHAHILSRIRIEAEQKLFCTAFLPEFPSPTRSVQKGICVLFARKICMPQSCYVVNTFCEDCVSEWFERERTCPLCRALVKPADLRSFGDGTTSLFFSCSKNPSTEEVFSAQKSHFSGFSAPHPDREFCCCAFSLAGC